MYLHQSLAENVSFAVLIIQQPIIVILVKYCMSIIVYMYVAISHVPSPPALDNLDIARAWIYSNKNITHNKNKIP